MGERRPSSIVSQGPRAGRVVPDPAACYKPALDRTLGGFSSFAAGFSYLSILTGIFQLFHVGFAAGGPAFFWTWPAVFAGQFLVALCFAELAAHYPLAGSVYQWSKYAGSWALGWMAGWVYLASYIISIAAVALALQITLPQVTPWFTLVCDENWNAVLLGCLLIGFTTVINAVGVRLLARINNVGVFTELAGAVLLIVLLAVHARRGPGALLDTHGRADGRPLGTLGALLAAALTASYVMYGFDTAGSLAEETREPRRRVPRAILQALSAAGVLGGLLILTGLLAAPDLRDRAIGQASGGLPYVVKAVLGPTLGAIFLCDVALAITVCTLAVHSGTVRLTFAMARDNNLPFGRILARVSPSSRTPVVPAVVAGVLAVGLLLVSVRFRHLIDVVASVAIVWANLAYLLVTVPLLGRRLRGWPAATGGFSLGRWGVPVNVLAVAAGVFIIVNVGWPRPDVYGEEWYERHAALLGSAVLLAVGGLYYGLVQRHKTGILHEHRLPAEAVATD